LSVNFYRWLRLLVFGKHHFCQRTDLVVTVLFHVFKPMFVAAMSQHQVQLSDLVFTFTNGLWNGAIDHYSTNPRINAACHKQLSRDVRQTALDVLLSVNFTGVLGQCHFKLPRKLADLLGNTTSVEPQVIMLDGQGRVHKRFPHHAQLLGDALDEPNIFGVQILPEVPEIIAASVSQSAESAASDLAKCKFALSIA